MNKQAWTMTYRKQTLLNSKSSSEMRRLVYQGSNVNMLLCLLKK